MNFAFSSFWSRAARRRALKCGCVVALGTLGTLSPLSSGALLAPAWAAPASDGANPDKYVLGSGDVVRVVVQDFAEFNQEGVMVPPDGVVTLPSFGTLKISGKTRLQLQKELTTALQKNARLRRPIVAVSITKFRSDIVGQVVLSGAVPRPGSIDLRAGQRLSDLMANAGLNERLEEKSATLLRGGQAISLSLKAAAQGPRGAADVVLRAGDVITVRQIDPARVTIRGAVAREGAYELHERPRPGAMEIAIAPHLSDLIDAAGGLRASATSGAAGGLDGAANGMVENGTGADTAPAVPGTAAMSTATPTYAAFLQRDGQSSTLDPETALAQVNSSANIALLPGDIVTINTVQPITVYLEGLVARPGSFSVPPGTGVLQLLTLAGGLTDSANGTAVAPGDIVASVRRGNQTLPLDLAALLLSSTSGANLTLRANDYVQLRAPDTIGVRVAGAVGKEGLQRLRPGATVMDALLGAGGLSAQPNEVRLNILRRENDGSQRVLSADASKITNLSDLSTNYALQEGDIVNVTPIQKQTVVISGEVNSPGPYQLRQGEGLAELITRAGGAQEDAQLTHIKIVRAGTQIEADAYDAVKLGQPLAFDLADGDYVVVPKNPDKILVMEAVSKPGYIAIPERGQLTLLDVVAQAQPQPGTKDIYLLRARADGTVDQDKKPRKISLEEVRRSSEGNIVLQPRDIVYVPTPKKGFNVRDILSFAAVGRLFF